MLSVKFGMKGNNSSQVMKTSAHRKITSVPTFNFANTRAPRILFIFVHLLFCAMKRDLVIFSSSVKQKHFYFIFMAGGSVTEIAAKITSSGMTSLGTHSHIMEI